MELKDCTKGRKVRVDLGKWGGVHFGFIDSVQDDLFGGKVVLVEVLGELKALHAESLEPIKRNGGNKG